VSAELATCRPNSLGFGLTEERLAGMFALFSRMQGRGRGRGRRSCGPPSGH
jgi:hypothetical protein